MSHRETQKLDEEMRCDTCVHYNPLPGMEHTGVCDEDALNKRLNLGVVMTSADDVCWEWEKDREY